jgi:hypothetical protein
MTDEAATLKDAPSPAGQAGRPQGSVVDEIRGASQDVAREARATGDSLRREGAGLAGTIRQGLSNQVEQQKNGIADRLSTVAERAQRSAADLRRDEPWLGDMLGRGAVELEGLAAELRRNDVSDLMGSVETFARRQPALFMGATVALGYALTRFVGAGGGHEAGGYPPRSGAGDRYPGMDAGTDRGGV